MEDTETPRMRKYGKWKRLKLWWQLYRTSLPERDVRNITAMGFCSFECTLSKISDIQSENTGFKTLCFPPLTGICSDTAVRAVLALLFLRSLSSPVINIVVGCKIWSCHELNPRNIFHTLGFITANFLHVCVMIIAGLLEVHAIIWMEVSYGKCNCCTN